jgi:hypothetical protein
MVTGVADVEKFLMVVAHPVRARQAVRRIAAADFMVHSYQICTF